VGVRLIGARLHGSMYVLVASSGTIAVSARESTEDSLSRLCGPLVGGGPLVCYDPACLQEKSLQLMPVYANAPLADADRRQKTLLNEFISPRPRDLQLLSDLRYGQPRFVLYCLHALPPALYIPVHKRYYGF
jgi:hypothetical protein